LYARSRVTVLDRLTVRRRVKIKLAASERRAKNFSTRLASPEENKRKVGRFESPRPPFFNPPLFVRAADADSQPRLVRCACRYLNPFNAPDHIQL
jgi:hypothetical protein